MKRTRKWAYVEQEVKRLVELGVAGPEIAKRIGVDPSTVRKWMRAGKMGKPGRSRPGRTVHPKRSPESWAREVRATYALDVSDDQRVSLAEQALLTAYDRNQTPAVRLNAMRTFDGIVKRLNLVARDAAASPQQEPEAPKLVAAPAQRPRVDPRHVLTAVK